MTIKESAGAENERPDGSWLVIGLATSILMWTVWFVTHMPAVDAAAAVTIPLFIAILAVSIGLGGWLVGRTRAFPAGLAAGACSGVLNLLLLGSRVVEQPTNVNQMPESANQLRPDAALVVLGFLVFSAAVGGIAGFIGGRLRVGLPTADRRVWLGRLGLVTMAGFLPLIVVGGVVTSTGSGMAVPDPVTSYGAVSFLFPFSLMADPGIFFEHSHRLFGTLTGLTTLILLIRVLMVDRRGGVRALAGVLFLGVVAQGVVGILRVGEDLAWAGAIHGVVAQMVFALAVWLWALLSPKWGRGVGTISSAARKASLIALACIMIQLTFGAMYRHLGQPHALWAHIGFSLVVVSMTVILGFICMTAKEGKLARSVRIQGIHLFVVVAIQFLLGGMALMVVMGAKKRGMDPGVGEVAVTQGVPAFEALVTTAHQAIGAALLGFITLVTVWCRGLTPVRGSDQEK